MDPLRQHVDPDVVVKLPEQDGGEWRFTFRFADHEVTVADESRVFVDGQSCPYCEPDG